MENWPVAPDGSCYGGINSFGFGGTNAHAVLSSSPDLQTKTTAPAGTILWPFSARSVPALRASLDNMRAYLHGLDEDDGRRRAVAQSRRRSGHSHHRVLRVDDRRELAA